MAILDVQVGFTGRANADTNLAFITTDNTVAEVLASGFLDPVVRMGTSLNDSNMCVVRTKTSPSASTSQVGWYEVSITNGSYSLVPTASPGAAVLPTVLNHLAYFTNTTGTISSDAVAAVIHDGSIQAGRSGVAGNLGSFPSTAARGGLFVSALENAGDFAILIRNASHAQATTYSIPDCGATTANFITSKRTGTQQITVGSLQVTAGDMTVGLSTGGTAGRFVSFSATTTAGSLILAHVANGSGNFNTTISSAAAVGQSQVITIPDALGATGRFIVATSAALVNGNLLKNSGTGGAVVDAGIIATQVQLNTLIKAAQVTGLGGAGAGPLSISITGCTASSIVVVSILASSNTVSVAKVLPGSGSASLTLSGDPGATLTIQYVCLLGAQ